MNKGKTKTLQIIIVVATVAGLLTWFVVWANSPQQGTISAPQPPKGPTTYSDKQLNGTYISFQYSGKYIARSEGAKDNDLELFTLSAATQYEKRIQVSVASLPDGNLKSNGSYIYRQNSPNTYSSRKVNVNNTPVDVWVKKDGTEQTVMISRGDKVAVISFVTTNVSDNLTEEVDAVLKTFRWKQ